MDTSVTKEIQIDAPGEKVWAILADIGSVQDYSPGVVKSYYTSEMRMGVGASRHCDLLPKGTVEERIVSWREGEQYAIEIYDWADVPYTGISHFIIQTGSEGTTVTQTMDYQSTNDLTAATKGRPMEEFVAIVVDGNLLGLKHFIETGEVVNREVFKRIMKSRGA